MRLCQQVLPVLFISRVTKSTEFRNKMPIDSEIKQKKIHCLETKRKLSHQIVLYWRIPNSALLLQLHTISGSMPLDASVLT